MTLVHPRPHVEAPDGLVATFVALRSTGLTLPSFGPDLPALDLGYPQLRLLEALASSSADVDAVAAETGTPADELAQLLTELAARGLASDRHAPAPGAWPARPPDEALEWADGDQFTVLTPLLFLVTPDGFLNVDHDRRVRARLGAVELSALASFREPGGWRGAISRHRSDAGSHALKEAGFRELVDRMVAVGLLERVDPDAPTVLTPHDRAKELADSRFRNLLRIEAATDRHLAEVDAREPRADRVAVVPMQNNGGTVPLALGVVMAYAEAYDGGRLKERYQFRPDWPAAGRNLDEVDARQSVYLFSNYIWSHAVNLRASEKVKQVSPTSVCIHGGPDSPKYPGDSEQYFRTNPHIDVVVHGEGEETAAEVLSALADRFDGGPVDLSVLRDVPGISFRLGDEIVRTADRDRIADLDSIPSPYLTGLFRAYGEANVTAAFIETNRGCPYGCTFCDWGSATLARIRKFDLERIYAEIEWCAQHEVTLLYICDANFGIFERDVEIAEKIAEVKRRYGYPTVTYTNYAKNTIKHLKKIVEMWVDAGIITNGLLSLQSVDDGVLQAVNRKNIKVEKYDELAVEFRKAKLPLYVDLMMGLPGSTTETLLADMQDCVEREVIAKMHLTTVLPNSPMNDPGYREKFKIEIAEPLSIGKGNPATQVVVSSSTFTRKDVERWREIRRNYLVLENFGVLRQVARYVRQETGRREVDFYDDLRGVAHRNAERWPSLHFIVRAGPDLLAPPMSWGVLLDEVREHLVEDLGIADDSALDTVLAVQHALLPAPERTFPYRIDLAHDYAAWHAAMVDAKEARLGDWVEQVPHLRDFGPGTLTVEDPDQVCRGALGFDIENGWMDSWEMDSPVSRPIPVRPARF